MDRSEELIALAALAPPEEAVDAWQEWRATVPIASASTLLTWASGYIHRNLLAAGVDEPYLRGIYRHNLLSNSRRLVAAIPAIRDITSRWEVTPLKSFGMTGDRYSRGLRPLADFDFYVARDDALAVKSRLETLGFGALMKVGDDEFARRILRQRGSWNFTNQDRTDLDLHWRLLEHLSTATSLKLVQENSTVADSEFGSIRRLDDELMLICIGVHHQLGTRLMNGFFDFAHLLKFVDTDRTAQLAVETNSVREIGQLCRELQKFVGSSGDAQLDRLMSALSAAVPDPPHQAASRVVPRLFEPLPKRYFEPELLARPAAYRVWFALGRRALLERILMRLGGPFSRRDGTPSDSPPTQSGVLGIGWHYLYPLDGHRWANIPDARVVFTDRGDANRVRIDLDPDAWRLTPIEAFGVFVNGRHLGFCDRSASGFEFALPAKGAAGTLEISLRPTDRRRYTHPGIHQKWYRMLAPVQRIDILP